MAEAYERRQERLRARLAAEDLTGLIVTHAPNIRYLTGFTGSSGVLLFGGSEPILVTDARYETQAAEEVGGRARVDVVTGDVWERVAQCGDAAGQRWGFESESVAVATAERLAEAGRRDLRATRGFVEDLRVRKEPAEVAAIRCAAVLAAEAYAETLRAIRPGVSEREIAAELETALRRRGSEWHPFPTIVASGPRGALPHARTSGRAMARGDLVVLDFGAQVDGYCADLTRTVVIGRADERQRAIYELVREAQQAAAGGLRPGMTGGEADALARGVIEARGFGHAFGHSLGHGLGLEVHEAPRLSRTNTSPLPAAAVVTIEPGIYLTGWGGVRLEDDLVLHAGGAESLSNGAPELVEV